MEAAEYVDILVFKEGKKLHYFNRFIYQTETDFIYYLLLVCDESKINREQVYLVFSGEVNINSKLYDIAFRYFLHISFFKSSSSIVFAKAFDTFPKHLHLFLYSSYADYLP